MQVSFSKENEKNKINAGDTFLKKKDGHWTDFEWMFSSMDLSL